MLSSNTQNYYTRLGVSAAALKSEIKAAFRRLAREFHPDKGNQTADNFIAIREAYDTLSDPEKRKEYDRKLSATGLSDADYSFQKDVFKNQGLLYNFSKGPPVIVQKGGNPNGQSRSDNNSSQDPSSSWKKNLAILTAANLATLANLSFSASTFSIEPAVAALVGVGILTSEALIGMAVYGPKESLRTLSVGVDKASETIERHQELVFLASLGAVGGSVAGVALAGSLLGPAVAAIAGSLFVFGTVFGVVAAGRRFYEWTKQGRQQGQEQQAQGLKWKFCGIGFS